jgi:alpha-tubulin suppressor-like RCC1 family protein
LGDGTQTFRTAPVQTTALANIIAITAGGGHTCAVRQDGTAWCWGLNGHGQLGNNSTTDSLVPVQVSVATGLVDVVSISAGIQHTCAVTSTGTLWCWGLNDHGQLGDNTTTDAHVPAQITGLPQMASVSLWGQQPPSAGNDDAHTCAAAVNGTVWCWGANSAGQLGDNTATERHAPVQVSNLTDVSWITTGDKYTCARKTDATAWCWGYNTDGRLGDGSATDRWLPVPVLANVQMIDAGGGHTCALGSNATASCWGENSSGQVGDGTVTTRLSPEPVQTPPASFSFLSAGREHTCGLTGAGAAWCWGLNNYGQLGIGSQTDQNVPTPVLDP